MVQYNKNLGVLFRKEGNRGKREKVFLGEGGECENIYLTGLCKKPIICLFVD